MARPTKPEPFQIYEDAGPLPLNDNPSSSNEQNLLNRIAEDHVENEAMDEQDSESVLIAGMDTILPPNLYNMEHDVNDDRRESGLTHATFSTLPESNFDEDLEDERLIRSEFPPVLIRPPFMRPESVRRMQMSSPPPFVTRSPRRSITRSTRSRTGTPRSVRSVMAHEGLRSRRALSIDMDDSNNQEYPLVLLHVTLLPIGLSWSVESMREVLPSETLENLERLRTKVSEIVLQRGILVPHPQHEYELLEERLLEALDLVPERLTKCGHFRNRDSTSSQVSTVSSGRESDSALGSSIEGSVEDLCLDCHHEIKSVRRGIDKTWTIEVFAANGLMRAPAWAAAWSEMERVDVRISPWISEADRRRLDAMKTAEHAEREANLILEQSVASDAAGIADEKACAEHSSHPGSRNITQDPIQRETNSGHDDHMSRDRQLPKIYSKPSDIPVSLLLRNYLALLAQDPRNVIIFFLVTGLLFATMNPFVSSEKHMALASLNERGSIIPALDGSAKVFSAHAGATPSQDHSSLESSEAVRNRLEVDKIGQMPNSDLIGSTLDQVNESVGLDQTSYSTTLGQEAENAVVAEF